jgi:hypothetical protein
MSRVFVLAGVCACHGVSGFWYKIPEKTFSVKFAEVTFPSIGCMCGGHVSYTRLQHKNRDIFVFFPVFSLDVDSIVLTPGDAVILLIFCLFRKTEFKSGSREQQGCRRRAKRRRADRRVVDGESEEEGRRVSQRSSWRVRGG